MKSTVRYFFLLVVCGFVLHGFSQNVDANLLTVHFKKDGYTLSSKEKQRIDSFFKVHPEVESIRLSGHTDIVGRVEYNNKLSAKRANAVAAYIGSFSEGKKIIMEHHGEKIPLQGQNNARNRRVEISFRQADVVQMPAEQMQLPEAARGNVDTTIIKKLTFEKIYFVPDKAIVNMESFPYLDELAELVKTYATEKLEIRGHVNCPEWLSSNPTYMQKMDDLSEARAKEVYRQLVARGVSADRLTYKGMGNREMVYPEARTEAEQRKNMRVEIVVRK